MGRPFVIRPTQPADVQAIVDLQPLCFPPPFPSGLLWQHEHIENHLRTFPDGQFVAESDDRVVASSTSMIVSLDAWSRHGMHNVFDGYTMEQHDPEGQVLFGVDISVHPDWRSRGVGRALYMARFDLVRHLGLQGYGTVCRLPDFAAWHSDRPDHDAGTYAKRVNDGCLVDRTLTPLLRYGLTFVGVIFEYMEDSESGNAAAILEWKP